ncbi:hypothetical protein HDU98_006221 [Podochytrium sp. JEL0797]|nr:hypothetical protein HDU98_006221 [Podochytrium sp. JEL0797]
MAPQETSDLCFFYGTLMHPHVLFSVVKRNPNGKHPSSFENVTATAQDFKRFPIEGLPYPAMVRDAASPGVKGLVTSLTGLAEQTGRSKDEVVALLDEFEGNQYRRILVDVVYSSEDSSEVGRDATWRKFAGDNMVAKAWAYEFLHLDCLVRDKGDWSFERFVKEDLADYI